MERVLGACEPQTRGSVASEQADEPRDGEIESVTESFVLRIWPIAQTRRPTPWRGRITHVRSGEQRGVQSFDEIIRFIRPYLKRMGVAWHRRWWWR
jgi:hypothetical protein